MKIIFELIDKQYIKILGVEGDETKEIGCIFTPSGSGQNIQNAIQICGIEEVFDYWGCSRYMKPKDNLKGRILNSLENRKGEYSQMKDIQIMFNFESEQSNLKKRDINFGRDCDSCFNYPCTCENKGDHKEKNPFNIKREGDLENKSEYVHEHLPLKEQEKLLSDVYDKKI